MHIRWLHIPKTGQTFAITLFLFGCPIDISKKAIRYMIESQHPSKVAIAVKKYKPSSCNSSYGHIMMPMNGHKPYNEFKEKKRLCLFLRHPSSRQISHYEYFKAFNRNKKPWGKYDTWIASNSNLHCQTKMLNGFQCNFNMKITSQHLQKAIKILNDDSLFIGLQEKWDTSIALFHCKFMKQSEIFEEELLNIHKTAYKNSISYANVHDDKDEYLYNHASSIFYKQIMQYNTCIQYLLNHPHKSLRL